MKTIQNPTLLAAIAVFAAGTFVLCAMCAAVGAVAILTARADGPTLAAATPDVIIEPDFIIEPEPTAGFEPFHGSFAQSVEVSGLMVCADNVYLRTGEAGPTCAGNMIDLTAIAWVCGEIRPAGEDAGLPIADPVIFVRLAGRDEPVYSHPIYGRVDDRFCDGVLLPEAKRGERYVAEIGYDGYAVAVTEFEYK